jgi:integrase/recombinase XerC
VLAGRRISGDGIHKILQTMGAKLGGIIRPHGLRHTAITAALDENNGNVRQARLHRRAHEIRRQPKGHRQA